MFLSTNDNMNFILFLIQLINRLERSKIIIVLIWFWPHWLWRWIFASEARRSSISCVTVSGSIGSNIFWKINVPKLVKIERILEDIRYGFRLSYFFHLLNILLSCDLLFQSKFSRENFARLLNTLSIWRLFCFSIRYLEI